MMGGQLQVAAAIGLCLSLYASEYGLPFENIDLFLFCRVLTTTQVSCSIIISVQTYNGTLFIDNWTFFYR